MKKEFRPNDVVILNRPIMTRQDLILTPHRAIIPIYGATAEGIYKIDRKRPFKKSLKSLSLVALAIVGVFALLLGFFAILTTVRSSSFSALGLITIVVSVVFALIALAGVYLTYYSVKNLAKQRVFDVLEGELVVSWDKVKDVVVVNVRERNVADRGSLTLNAIFPEYKEVGDWHVLLKDSGEIIIPYVDDPHNKLNYVKKRFDLKF